MSNIKQIIENLDLKSAQSLGVALAESMGTNNITVGSTVAVIGDPTYPMDGQKGKVKSITNGFAKVEFGNGMACDCHINLLIPVHA